MTAAPLSCIYRKCAKHASLRGVPIPDRKEGERQKTTETIKRNMAAMQEAAKARTHVPNGVGTEAS